MVAMIIRIGSCISYYSYIKPQLSWLAHAVFPVVYHTIPTSNHNNRRSESLLSVLYIILFLHQTTTLDHDLLDSLCCISYYSYIKPQQPRHCVSWQDGCISYYSYIKPQLLAQTGIPFQVVYHTIPTSNHNSAQASRTTREVVYHTIPTSNHNSMPNHTFRVMVVYHTIPTSNHNWIMLSKLPEKVVYHTIPTSNHNWICRLTLTVVVVYHTIPTSNHNL